MNNNEYAKKAHEAGLEYISMWVWEACCIKYGFGGTVEAKRAYANIMRKVFEELPDYKFKY